MAHASTDLIKQLKKQIALTLGERARRDAILTSIGVGVIATDEQGKLIEVNQLALDMLGYKRDELIGKWFSEAIPALREDGSLVDNADRPMTRMFISGKSISENSFYQTRNNSRLPVSVTVSPILLKGKPIGAIEIFRDITMELGNDRLKTEFISIASHQLRTPLSAISTYAHMLEEKYAGDLNDKQASFIKVILSAATRMNELTTTLLNITRVEVGNITIESNPTDLAILANNAVTEVMPEAIKKDIKLSIDINKDIPIINTDELVVREILTNILSNAIKYTPAEGLVKVKLYTKGNDVIFWVKDNGYGIPVDAQPRIFTKFFRADNASQLEPTGTGLGLYLIKILVEKLNGEVWFKSREHHGTSFYFSLSKNGSIAKKEKFRLETI